MMDCGRLARRIAWVMFWKRIVTRETLFTSPKPLVHLICQPVNIVPGGTISRREDELTKIECRCS